MKTLLTKNLQGNLVTKLRGRFGSQQLSFFQNDFGGFDVLFTDNKKNLHLHDDNLTLDQLNNCLQDFQNFGTLDQLK
jgi:hypothetical protein